MSPSASTPRVLLATGSLVFRCFVARATRGTRAVPGKVKASVRCLHLEVESLAESAQGKTQESLPKERSRAIHGHPERLFRRSVLVVYTGAISIGVGGASIL